MGMLEMAVGKQRNYNEQDRNAKNNPNQSEQSADKQQEQAKPAWENYAQNQRDAAKEQVEGKGLGSDLHRDHEERSVAQEQEKNFYQAHGRYQKSGEELDKFTYEHDNDPKVIKDRQIDAYREDTGKFPRNDSDLTRWNDKQAKLMEGQNKSQAQGQQEQATDIGSAQQQQGKSQGSAQSRFGEQIADRQGQSQSQAPEQEQGPQSGQTEPARELGAVQHDQGQGKDQPQAQEQAAQSQEAPSEARSFGSKLESQRKGPPSLEEGVSAAREDARNRSAQINQEQEQGKTRSLGRG